MQLVSRERQIRKALKIISGQRVVMVLQPGNVLVIENSPNPGEWFDAAVQTCRIRGWVEVLHDGIPSAELKFRGGSPDWAQPEPKVHYRLTDGGWNAIHRSHALLIVTVVLSALSLAAGAASVVLALR